MKTALTIAEFNPFHNGHAYLAEQARRAGADTVVAVMSGNWVQRGDTAIYDKFTRARAAVKGGADLVIELPVPWAMSSAAVFARAAVTLGCAAVSPDYLIFGSECGSAEILSAASDALKVAEHDGLIAEELSSGVTFAAARQRAVEKVSNKEVAGVLSGPNDALALEYLSALPSEVTPICVKRLGQHDSNGFSEKEFPSASLLRSMIAAGRSLEGLVPSESLKCFPNDFALASRLDIAVLCLLRRLRQSDFAHAPDISEGLENRLYKAVQKASSVDELLSAVKTKRYTLARLRRIVYSLFIGVDPRFSHQMPPYIRVLACNEKGERLFAAFPKDMPVLIRASDKNRLSGFAAETFELESAADSLHFAAYAGLRPSFDFADIKVITPQSI